MQKQIIALILLFAVGLEAAAKKIQQVKAGGE
jgi:hypothetical protein